MARRPSPEYISAFVDSLPKAYAEKYDADVIVAHAAVANQRGDAVAVGLFGRAGNGLCVIANDRPGLLSLIAASLVVCQLDVHQAEVYTRELGDGHREAVDLFWVRKLDAPPGTSLVQADGERLRQTLVDFIDGQKDPRAAVERRIAEKPGPSGAIDATVRFLADPAGGLATLEVETTDRSGLLYSLASALFSQHVQIVESEVHTVDARVFDRFRIVELDGTAISSARRLEIQVAVLHAIEPARRTLPPANG